MHARKNLMAAIANQKNNFDMLENHIDDELITEWAESIIDEEAGASFWYLMGCWFAPKIKTKKAISCIEN